MSGGFQRVISAINASRAIVLFFHHADRQKDISLGHFIGISRNGFFKYDDECLFSTIEHFLIKEDETYYRVPKDITECKHCQEPKKIYDKEQTSCRTGGRENLDSRYMTCERCRRLKRKTNKKSYYRIKQRKQKEAQEAPIETCVGVSKTRLIPQQQKDITQQAADMRYGKARSRVRMVSESPLKIQGTVEDALTVALHAPKRR